MLIPAEVTIVPTFVLVSRLGMVDSLSRLIVPGMFSVFATFPLRQSFLTIPFELEDAAKIDGAGYFWRYAQIVLPLSQPAMATAAIFVFIGSWRNFLWPLIIIRTRELRTVPIGLAAIQREQGHTDVPQLMAGAVLAIVPVILVFLALQKHYIEGIAMSGIKGWHVGTGKHPDWPLGQLNKLVETNWAFRNVEGTHFELAPEWNMGLRQGGRGMTVGDVDFDGDLDVIVNNLLEPTVLLEILWPDGELEIIHDVQAEHLYTVIRRIGEN